MVDDVMNRDVIVLRDTEARRVGEGIRDLRLRRVMPLAELARRANVSHDYLLSLEEGHELKIERSVLDSLRQASSEG